MHLTSHCCGCCCCFALFLLYILLFIQFNKMQLSLCAAAKRGNVLKLKFATRNAFNNCCGCSNGNGNTPYNLCMPDSLHITLTSWRAPLAIQVHIYTDVINSMVEAKGKSCREPEPTRSDSLICICNLDILGATAWTLL